MKKAILGFFAAAVVALLVWTPVASTQPTGWLSWVLETPQGAVQFRALTKYGEPALIGSGTAAPTAGNSGAPPSNGELFSIEAAGALPVLTQYDQANTTWRSMMVSTLVTNAPDVASSVWGVSAGVSFEGATADASEFTIQADEPVADQTFLLNSWGAANTTVLLDTGIAPADGNTLPANDWSDVIHSRHQTAIYFRQSPAWGGLAPATTGGFDVCSTTGNPNFLVIPGFPYYLEMDAKGTNTACAPTWAAATGMNIVTDGAADEGFEITAGITAASPAAFVVGTDPAFYMKVVIDQATVAESDEFYCGFRLAEAYDATTCTTYDTYLAIGYGDLADGAVYQIRQLNEIDGGGHANTVLTTHGVWADGIVHTLEVRVDAAGNGVVWYDGAIAAENVAFAFTATDVIIPFCNILDDATGTAQAINFYRMEWGLQ